MKTLPILAALTLTLPLAGAPASAQAPAKGKPAPAREVAATASFKDAKLAAIDAWLSANKGAPDRADALVEAANLAFDLGHATRSQGYAEAYIKEFPKGGELGDMQLMVGRSLAAQPGKEADARKSFEQAIADAGEDVNRALAPAFELADMLAAAGDIDGAKKPLQDLSAKFSKVRGLGDHIQGKIDDLDEYGKPPTPIDVLGFDGKPINLDDMKGKVVLIDFWATWCGPCVAELPNVIATYKKHHAAGFEIVGISLDEDEGKLKDFLAKNEMPWPQFFDGKGWKNEVGQAYGVSSIPRTYLLDREGIVRGIGLRGPALGTAVAKLLGPKVPAK